MKPLVSVIIPTYNRGQAVCEAIDSVLSQTYPHKEIIVIDDGSKDNTAQMLSKYNGSIKYIHQENQGNSVARNNGMKYVSGKYVAFLDDDDLWLPNKLEIEVDCLENHLDHGFVYSATYYMNEKGEVIGQRTLWDDEDSTFERLYKGNIIISPSVTLCRKSCIDKIGGFDTGLIQSSDYDFFLRLARISKFAYIDKILSKYRIHEGNLSRNLDRRLQCHIKIIKKNEVSGHLPWFKRRIRMADDYYQIATYFYQDRNFLKAAWYYMGAVLQYPFIGFYHWPKEIKKMKFSFLYRVLKVYLLILYCFVRGLFQRPPQNRKYY